KFYSFDSSVAPDGDWQQESAATPMNPGVGYIIRGPQENWAPNPPATAKASFVGVPNNGHYEITGIIPDRSYLLGNPYPSALDADAFLDANQNVLDGTLYFWTHNTPIAVGTPDPGSGLYAYSGNDYASYNRTGGVGTAAPSSVPPFTGLNDNIPTGKIASGQGFFGGSKVSLPSNPKIIYDNTMRVGVGTITGDNTQFFKTKNPKEKTANTVEKHRVWLDLTNAKGAFKQTLVGYVTGATNDYEGRFDGESYDGNDFLDFYSIDQDKNLTIQGRALPFDVNDEIPLGYRVVLDGTFTIKIGKTDGVLSNQEVYLEDKLTNSVFNLKEGNYTFTTTAGTFDDRFVLRYTDKTLGIEEVVLNDGIIVLYSNNFKTLIIRNNVKDATVNSVSLYNLAGQNIANWDVKGREQTLIQIPIKNLPSEIYIVKVKTNQGESSKKIIIKE
ncbi:MAG TPA: T9SS type A sorting domain-containing protein, partial [Flavobacterium sp.]|nr:T9SS type A sorting domain-containing protein [Flavobacterium sp.]